MNKIDYNPDILTFLANLSSDEVFTSSKLANDILDLLPKELWKDPNAKFLDPCSKTGVFLREITKRLIEGLNDIIPNLQDRINHILTNQVYGLSITELTSLISRRSLYCTKTANFVNQAKKLSPKYLSMIIPSRWMKGGKGLQNFRNEMMNDTRIKYIYDFEDARECFPGITLDGGVCYFLWDKNYSGPVDYKFKALDGTVHSSTRYLKNDCSETVIRDPRQISILEKVTENMEDSFSKIVSTRNPYGFNSDLFNKPERYPNTTVLDEYSEGLCRIYGVKGKKGGSKRVVGYLPRESIIKDNENLEKYKLYFSKAYMTTSTVPPEIICGEPNDLCTETFLEIGGFDTELESENCLQYIRTKFFRALLFFNRHSLNISQQSFELIPLLTFDHLWTDKELYRMYNLSNEEINFIEELVKPMPGGN